MFGILRRMFPNAQSPVDITPDMANDYTRRRAEQALSAWSIRSDLATLKAIFGKWLGRACGLVKSNPFAEVSAPRCGEPDVRIVAAEEKQRFLAWLDQRWNDWRLPRVCLDVLAWTGWRSPRRQPGCVWRRGRRDGPPAQTLRM
jgi:site-specific recombinase XerD